MRSGWRAINLPGEVVSDHIPLDHSLHFAPGRCRAVIAEGRVKQISFHCYLVTVRFSFSLALVCNSIGLVPLPPCTHTRTRTHTHTHAHARTHTCRRKQILPHARAMASALTHPRPCSHTRVHTHTHTGVHKPPRRNLEPSRAGAKTPTRALGEREGSSEVYWRVRGRKKERDREQERVRKV